MNRIAASPPPLFILGHWRSGTTLLHSLLARDLRFVAPTNYQTLFPSHFLLTERIAARITARFMPATRPADNIRFTWNAPAEDEIATLVLTGLSPYRDIALSSATREPLPNTPEQWSHWTNQWLNFLRKLQVPLAQPRRPLLKSPTHTGRIPRLLRLFPDAQFIYIIRNPYDVFASTRHLYHVLAASNNLGRPRPIDYDNEILHNYQQFYHAYHLHRALIPRNRCCEVRFEDLEADPVTILQSIYERLELDGFEDFKREIEPMLPEHRAYRKNHFTLSDETRALVYDNWKPAFRRYGYSPDPSAHPL